MLNGRPGPVVMALPEDMLRERAGIGDARPFREMQAAPAPADMARLRELLLKAERPMALVGGGGWDRAAVAGFEAFAQAFDLPTAVSFRCQAYFDNRLKQYAGHAGVGIDPALGGRIEAADLLLAAGARLGEATTNGYTLVKPPVPDQALIHIHPGAEELGRVFQPALGINAGMKHFAAAAAALDAPASVSWGAWRQAIRNEYLAYLRPHPVPGDVQIGEIVAWLSDRLPEDAIVCNGAGNYNGWLHKNFVFKGYRTQIGATSGSMGYGTPAAIAVKLAEPGKTVVNWSGDGCFLMHGQELATAMQYGANVISYRRQQRHARHHPDASGTGLPDAHLGDGIAQPGLQRARRILRPARRGCAHDRRVRPGLRALRRGGPAVADRSPGQPGSRRADPHGDRNARGRAGAAAGRNLNWKRAGAAVRADGANQSGHVRSLFRPVDGKDDHLTPAGLVPEEGLLATNVILDVARAADRTTSQINIYTDGHNPLCPSAVSGKVESEVWQSGQSRWIPNPVNPYSCNGRPGSVGSNPTTSANYGAVFGPPFFLVAASCASKLFRSSIFCRQSSDDWLTIGCHLCYKLRAVATNPKIEFRLPPILHSYLEDLSGLGAYGKGAAGVAKKFVEQGIADALEKKVIAPKNVRDFDDDDDEASPSV